MSLMRCLCSICVVNVFAAGVQLASAQDYPTRSVRIVTQGAGGNSDVMSRVIAQGLSPPLGQQVIVDNRSPAVSGELVAKAAPDGYTLLVTGSTFWTGPLLQKTPYDPLNDFAPISLIVKTPNILVVHPSLPVANVKDLIALARAHPGMLNYASGQTGASSHLAAELFNHMAGVRITRIGYKGGGEEMPDLVAGRVQLEFGTAGSMMPYVKSRRLKAIAVTTAEPSALAPGLPTVAASGLPGYQSGSYTGMFAPAKTSMNIITRLSREATVFLNLPETKARLLAIGAEAVGSPPEQLTAMMKSEVTRLGKVIRDAGIRVE